MDETVAAPDEEGGESQSDSGAEGLSGNEVASGDEMVLAGNNTHITVSLSTAWIINIYIYN